MSDTLNDFSGQYQAKLKEYIVCGGEAPLHEAYELGRRALSEGTGLLDLTFAHQAALVEILTESANGPKALLQYQNAANRFLDEALSPFEVSRLSSQDANTALRRLYDVLEEEAKRIAHILHDESAQMLATVYLELASIARDAPDSIASRVNQVVSYLDEVREQLRGLSHELRPLILDQLGLVPALRYLAAGVRKRTGLEVEVTSDIDGRQDQAIETVMYRTVQEALANVTRHAGASRAQVRTWIENEVIYCTVTDDGAGFEVPDERRHTFQGLGLVGIQERVGALHGNMKIVSSPGRGTELRVSIPL